MREIMGALGMSSRANLDVSTSYDVEEMNGVVGAGLENERRRLLNDSTTEPQKHPKQSHEHLQEYHHRVRRHSSEVQQELRIQQVASGEEVENLSHDL